MQLILWVWLEIWTQREIPGEGKGVKKRTEKPQEYVAIRKGLNPAELLISDFYLSE
jgi:hypothetical protein